MITPEQEKMKNDLLPCPFCGAGHYSIIREKGGRVRLHHWCKPTKGFVNEKDSMAHFYIHFEIVAKSKEHAYCQWNFRAEPVNK